MKITQIVALLGLSGFGLSGLLAGSLAQAQQLPQSTPPVPAVAPAPTTIAEAVPAPNVLATIAQAQDTLSARTLVRLDQLSRQLSEATGRIETLEAAIAAQKSEGERMAGLLDATRAAQSTQAGATSGDAKAMTTDQAAAIMAVPAAAAAVVEPMFAPPTPPPIAPPIMLTNARSALQSGNYPVAEANLTQLIWVYPTSPEASEGRWLLGEARYVQSAWGTAAQAYVDYLKASPDGPRANEALLRLAGSFRQLGDNRQRCVALAEFKRRTPRPDPTLKARADGEIARVACPA
jgi:TolA-binding protein